MKTIVVLIFFAALSAAAQVHGENKGDGALINCRIDSGPCVQKMGPLTASFDISPKPVKAMREVSFTLLLKEGLAPVTDAAPVVSLSMPGMYMGANKVLLIHQRDGLYEGKGVIVRCPSGKKIWQAEVSVKRKHKTAAARYIFEVD